MILSLNSNAQTKLPEDTFPVPEFNSLTQFYLQRTTDANTVIYDLNMENGLLNEKEPIRAYWIRYTEKGVKKNLSGIQAKFAFGVKSTRINSEHFKLQLAGYDKVPLHLWKLGDGIYQTRVIIDQQELVLRRLYIHIEPGGTFWSPNVAYIEFKGIDLASGRYIQKRITPET